MVHLNLDLDLRMLKPYWHGKATTCSDFVANTYGESWDSSCEKSSVPVHTQLKKTRTPKLKMPGPSCNQTVYLETDAKTFYYSLLKLKCSPSIS